MHIPAPKPNRKRATSINSNEYVGLLMYMMTVATTAIALFSSMAPFLHKNIYSKWTSIFVVKTLKVRIGKADEDG